MADNKKDEGEEQSIDIVKGEFVVFRVGLDGTE